MCLPSWDRIATAPPTKVSRGIWVMCDQQFVRYSQPRPSRLSVSRLCSVCNNSSCVYISQWTIFRLNRYALDLCVCVYVCVCVLFRFVNMYSLLTESIEIKTYACAHIISTQAWYCLCVFRRSVFCFFFSFFSLSAECK